ncbi:hypothetical protein C5B78_07355 [Aeromonas salmonicida]|nr:hypothetical protein C5B78_07355 [Aeromonas salmonicida]
MHPIGLINGIVSDKYRSSFCCTGRRRLQGDVPPRDKGLEDMMTNSKQNPVKSSKLGAVTQGR